MCVFIYNLPQLCGHKHFQNVAECAVARGAVPLAGTHGEHEPRPGHRSESVLLREPKFLFDTARDATRTPDWYARRFACRKRKAVRPSPTMCEGCARAAARRRDPGVGKKQGGGMVAVGKSQVEMEVREVVKTPVRKTGAGLLGGAAARVLAATERGVLKKSETTGSEVALIAGSASVSDVGTLGTSASMEDW